MKNNIIETLKRTRESRGITQQKLADLSGVAQANISKIENGAYNPSLQIVKRLAEAMGTELCIEFREKQNEHNI